MRPTKITALIALMAALVFLLVLTITRPAGGETRASAVTNPQELTVPGTDTNSASQSNSNLESTATEQDSVIQEARRTLQHAIETGNFEFMSSAKQNALQLMARMRYRNGALEEVDNSSSASGITTHEETDANIVAALFEGPDGIPNPLVNNRAADATAQKTQSETTIILSGGANLVCVFNDSGSFLGGVQSFTGFSTSTDSGATWLDRGALPPSTVGTFGDPVLVRKNSSGKLFLSTLAGSTNGMDIYNSTDNGVTWNGPVNGAPGTTSGDGDKEWIAVDNFVGTGNGNIYHAYRDFGANSGVLFTRSTNDGVSFAPSPGLLIASGAAGNVQGAFTFVGADHAVYVGYYDSVPAPDRIAIRKSTDQGLTFSTAVTVSNLVTTGVNGSLNVPAGYRSSAFPQFVASPTNANLLFSIHPDLTVAAGSDSNIYFNKSTDGGATWSANQQLNTDATTRVQTQPAIAITPDGTALCVTWQDNRLDAANTKVQRFGVVGAISGTTVTFGANFIVSQPNWTPVFGVDPVVNSVYMGDYDTMAADNSFFYTTFVDCQLGDQDVRFARIANPGATATPTATGTPPTPTATATATVTIPPSPTPTPTPSPSPSPTPTPGAQVVYGISNGFNTPESNLIYQINVANADLTHLVQVTLPGFTVYKSLALAARPSDGVLFAVVQTVNTGAGGRRLVKIDPVTGVCTDIGALSQAIACLAFRDNGTLYAVSGNQGPNPETLFTLDTTTGAATIAFALGNGDDGEMIAFHGNGLLYHSSGNATALFESINVDTQAVTPIGSAAGEAFAMGYSSATGQLFLSDISSNLYTVNIATGARTLIGTMSDQLGAADNRGLAFTTSCSFSENFDGVTAPALPTGWVASQGINVPAAPFWVTSTTTPDTAPNDAFSTDPANILDNYLDTPPVTVSSSSALLSFRNNFNLESTFDGGVLEVSSPNINGGAFTDVTNAAVGGSFATGGYTGPISTAFGSPIAGRNAWNGNSGGYVNTVANLGPNVAGQTIKLRFRMASDNSVAAVGWRVDSISLTGVNCAPCSAGVWTLAANYPNLIESPAVGTNGSFVYSAAGFNGGAGSTGFNRYDPIANSWTPLAPIPTALYATRGVYAANTNSFYVFGGYNGSVLNTTYIYNIGTNSWTTGAVMPGGRYFPNIVYYPTNGKIYVIGGFDPSFVDANQTWEYDPVANTWNTTRANIPIPMGGSATSIVGQYIYLAGTWNSGTGSTAHYRYDIVGNTWTPMAPVPVAVYEAASGSVDGQIYVIGGGNPSRPGSGPAELLRGVRSSTPDVPYNSTYIYSIAGNSWRTGPNTNVAHSFTAGTAVGNRLVVIGGSNGSGDTNTVETNLVSCPGISGSVVYCSNPSLNPVPNVTLALTGSTGTSTLTDVSGNYSLSASLGGFYTVTPSKAGLIPGSVGSAINTIDIVAVQRHFLVVGTPLSGCRLAAADVNGDNHVNTTDVVAIKNFFVGAPIGLANVGKYKFTPASRSYSPLTSDQTGQNYDAIVFGDVAATFVHRPEGPSQDAPAEETKSVQFSGTVTLPDLDLGRATSNATLPVSVTGIDTSTRFVGFQGDLIFDERVITFDQEPVQNAGLTGGNWTVSGNVLNGSGPMRTLRISAYSNDFAPLAGSGPLFELRISRLNKTGQSAPLMWAKSPDDLMFIDAELNVYKPWSGGL